MDSERGESAETSGRRLKVARLVDEYGLEEVGEALERRWTAEGDDRMSLRDLADYFNRRLLAETADDAGVHLLHGETGNTYSLLTADGHETGDRTRAKRRLERDGVDVARLLDDFVSYQAIRRYLTEVRDAEYARSDDNRIDTIEESLQRLKTRAARVTESKMEQLGELEGVSLGSEFHATVDIRVTCMECGSRFEVQELLDGSGCDCEG